MKNIFAKAKLKENVEYVLRDKNGNVKKLFQPNMIYSFLMGKGILPMGLTLGILGHFADKLTISNLVVNAGLAAMAGRCNGSGAPAAFTYIALGTDTTAAAAADVALGAEIVTAGGERAAATASLVTTTVANDTAQLQKTFTFTGSLAITESGVFNAASGVTMLARQVFAAINVANLDSLQITWKFAHSTV